MIIRVATAVPSGVCTHFGLAVQCILLVCATLLRHIFVDLRSHQLAEFLFRHADLAIFANPSLSLESGGHQMPDPFFSRHLGFGSFSGGCREMTRRHLASCSEIGFGTRLDDGSWRRCVRNAARHLVGLFG